MRFDDELVASRARGYMEAHETYHTLTVHHRSVSDPFDFVANARRRQAESEAFLVCQRAFVALAEVCFPEAGDE